MVQIEKGLVNPLHQVYKGINHLTKSQGRTRIIYFFLHGNLEHLFVGSFTQGLLGIFSCIDIFWFLIGGLLEAYATLLGLDLVQYS